MMKPVSYMLRASLYVQNHCFLYARAITIVVNKLNRLSPYLNKSCSPIIGDDLLSLSSWKNRF